MEAISMIVKDVRMTLLIALQILMARRVAEDPEILRRSRCVDMTIQLFYRQ